MPKQTVVELARERFKLSRDAWQDQRKREKAALEFQVAEKQWTDQAKATRQGGPGGGAVEANPRPMLSVNKIEQPIRRVANQERSAKLGVNVHPVSPDAKPETAEIFQDLYRQIERESQAHIARSWAFDRGLKAGLGWYRVGYTFDEAGSDPRDMRITIDRILDQASVYPDPAACKPDFSDGKFVFVTTWVRKEDFEQQWPDVGNGDGGQFSFDDAQRDTPDWVNEDGEKKAYLVAEYFYKEVKKEKVWLLKNGQTVRGRDLKGSKEPSPRLIAKDAEGEPIVREREYTTVKWCKLWAGDEPLEEEDWVGTKLPLIPYPAQELQMFDSERRYQGMIEPAMDVQRGYNYAISGAVEAAALEPRAPYVLDPRSIEGYTDIWKMLNIRNVPYLPFNSVVDGQEMPPPTRTQVDGSKMNISMQLANQFSVDIQAATQTFDPALGRQNSKERSGKAILANQDESDAANSNYITNLADITIPYEAEVVLELIPLIYERPGRIAQVLSLEEETSSIMVNAPFYEDPATGQPMPAPMDGTPLPPGAEVKNYDLKKGKYAISVTVGKSQQSRLAAGSDAMSGLLQAAPNLFPILGPEWARYQDFPGSRQLADMLMADRKHNMPWLDPEKPGTPEALQAENQQLKQQVQQMGQQLQQATQAIQTKQAEQGATVRKAEIDAQTTLQKTQLEQSTKLAIAEMENRIKALEAGHKAATDRAVASTDATAAVATEAIKAKSAADTATAQAFRGSATSPFPTVDEGL